MIIVNDIIYYIFNDILNVISDDIIGNDIICYIVNDIAHDDFVIGQPARHSMGALVEVSHCAGGPEMSTCT